MNDTVLGPPLNKVANHFAGVMADAFKHHKDSFVGELAHAVRRGLLSPEQAKVALVRAGLTTTGVEGEAIDVVAALVQAENFTLAPVAK